LRDETSGGQWSAELLQEATLVVASEIDWYKTHSIYQLSDLRVGVGVVTRDEQNAPTTVPVARLTC
jgi:hypothetical protein